MPDMDAYAQNEPVTMANMALGLCCEQNDTNLDVATAINRVKFDLQDAQAALNTQIEANADQITDCLMLEAKMGEYINSQIVPSSNQLERSFERLNSNVLQPYNEALSIHRVIKRVHQTNRLVRASSALLELSETILSEQREVKLLDKCKAIGKFEQLTALMTFLKPLNSIKEIEEKVKVVKGEILTRLNAQLGNLSKYQIINGSKLKLVNNELLNSNETSNTIQCYTLLDKKLADEAINKIFESTLNQAASLVNKNINNAKLLPTIVQNLSSVEQNLIKIQTQIKKTASDEQEDWYTKFWLRLGASVEPRINDVLNKGGPISRNFKALTNEIGESIKKVVPDPALNAVLLNSFKVIQK